MPAQAQQPGRVGRGDAESAARGRATQGACAGPGAPAGAAGPGLQGCARHVGALGAGRDPQPRQR